MLLLQIFVLAFSVKLILLFKTLVFGLFARGAELQDATAWAAVVTVSEELVDVLVLLVTIVPVLVLPVTGGVDDVTVAGAKDVVLDAVTAATEGIDGGWLGNGYWRPDFTEGLGLLYGCGLFIGDPDALQLPSRCKLGAGGVWALSACSGDCEARIVVLTGDTAVGFVDPIAFKVMGFFG